MYSNINILPKEIEKITKIIYKELDFPILYIDRDSYIVKATIETGLDFRMQDKCYSFHIGKYSSLAEDILFLIDMNHDHQRVFQGAVRELKDLKALSDSKRYSVLKRKGEILILNDVWIGNGATIMDGVTIHSGAVVAAKSVVTKDVPPYAIVAGNPAKIVKYRFATEVIKDLLEIQWWNWAPEIIAERSEWFDLPAQEFVAAYKNNIQGSDNKVILNNPISEITTGKKYVFRMDFNEKYSLAERVITSFCEQFKDGSAMLVLYSEEGVDIEQINTIVTPFLETDARIQIVDDGNTFESVLYHSDAYITGRSGKTAYDASIAEKYDKEIVHGCSIPIW